MLLIIENKDDPTGQIAEETDGPTPAGYFDYIYVPAIHAPLQGGAERAKLEYFLGRLRYEKRIGVPKGSGQPRQKLLPLFLKAVGHIGQRPKYITAAAGAAYSMDEKNGSRDFCVKA
ncbi:MAG TPA: hypothetical protein DG942_06925 [Ruminococcaceae bacterium]|jgi:hypothetical protein|nr:hypothetical protein [Oscillospiraceae bacterium]